MNAIKYLLSAFAAVLMLQATPALAGAQLETAMEEAFARCVKNFPDMRAVQAGHLKAGLRRRGSSGGMELHSGISGNLITLTQVNGKRPRCAFGADNMSVAATEAFAKKLIGKYMQAVSDPLPIQDKRRHSKVWAAKMNGHTVAIVISKKFKISNFYFGSMIMIDSTK